VEHGGDCLACGDEFAGRGISKNAKALGDIHLKVLSFKI
jgi:hypothetical protein